MRFILLLFVTCGLLTSCSTAKSRADKSSAEIRAALQGYSDYHHHHYPRTFAELQAYASQTKPLDLSPFTHFEYHYESPYSVGIYTTP